MDKYLNSFREMISLRSLTDHTLKNYCTYIRAYLDYLSNILHKDPEDVSWDELRDYIRWLQKSRDLSDRTINCAISQLRFFTMYVLQKHGMIHNFPCAGLTNIFLTYLHNRKPGGLFLPLPLGLKIIRILRFKVLIGYWHSVLRQKNSQFLNCPKIYPN